METMSCVVYFIIALITIIYVFFKNKFSYWARLGIPYIEPKIPFGNIQGIRKRFHLSQLMRKYYQQLKGKHPFGGIYFFIKPTALLLDLDLIKNVLIKDFSYFHDRGIFYNEKDDPISANLLSVDGHKWKGLRSKLTPTFTSGRMKFMFPTIVEVGDKFQQTLKEIVSSQQEIEMKDILARFTTDVIGTCAFGIECNSLKDPNAQFRQMGKKVFDVPRNIAIKQMFMLAFRKLALMLRMKVVHEDVSKFFMGIVQETVEFREKNNVRRNDFMDLLMQLRKSGKLEEDTESEGTGFLTLQEIAAQAFLFFLAGFETSSTVMSYCLYELALNQDIQEKAREEIADVLKRHEGMFTYEAMMEMTYLDKIIYESIRKYPPGANTIRMAIKDYIVPNTNNVIEKGMAVWVPIYAIHHDPDIYPDPEIFDPERFSPDAVKSRHPQSFLGFGDGPRNCIGLRFGMMQVRVGLVTLLKNFRFKACSKTIIPLKFLANNFILTAEGGLWLNVEPL